MSLAWASGILRYSSSGPTHPLTMHCRVNEWSRLVARRSSGTLIGAVLSFARFKSSTYRRRLAPGPIDCQRRRLDGLADSEPRRRDLHIATSGIPV